MEKITVKIDGMMCGHCEAHVNDTFKAKADIKSVKSDHEKKESVIITENPLTDDEIIAIVKETGYDFLGIEREPYEEKKGFFSNMMK